MMLRQGDVTHEGRKPEIKLVGPGPNGPSWAQVVRMVQMGLVVQMDRTGRVPSSDSLKEIVICSSEKNRILVYVSNSISLKMSIQFYLSKNIHKHFKCATLLLQMKANVIL